MVDESDAVGFGLLSMMNPAMMGALVAPILASPENRSGVIDAITEYLIRDEAIQRVIVETYDPSVSEIPTVATYQPRELATFLVARFASHLGIVF